MTLSPLLIANRGEIACRIIATARKLGMETVAVHSDADANARHVAMADRAVRIGPAPVGESYLRGEAIIAAAIATGAKAIHPGYGFLSENPAFVEAVENAGLVFVGPSASAIRAMGLKDAAKALMQESGVPIVPGYHGKEQNADFLAGEAHAIGYPVLIKARAGGGGKGMRLVERASDFHAALQGAQREGEASFGDPNVLIEKYITSPRHVEVQIFADAHGNVVHLFERDCSLQRRHQKVIEEAPAPGMNDETRAAMGHAAVEAARAIGYRGAGTVEFICDGSKGLRSDSFWFMEMNTRLQVEHPVSEAITGFDFVELQLFVAGGGKLPFTQQELKINGHAFEARLYAEDVPRGFLPATGRLARLAFPSGTEFEIGPVRVDSGVREGDEISPWYDPMIAKLIVHGKDRSTALAMLHQALKECRIAGSVTNLEFLKALAQNPDFSAGKVDTGLIARDLETLLSTSPLPPWADAFAAIAALGLLSPRNPTDPWDVLTGWRLWQPDAMSTLMMRDGVPIAARATALGKSCWSVVLGEAAPIRIEVRPDHGSVCQVLHEGTVSKAEFQRLHGQLHLFVEGRSLEYFLPDPLEDASGPDQGGDAVFAPMPGLVKIVQATAGSKVKHGDPLLVLEAMKMEHALCAPRDGTVALVLVADGDQVSEGTQMVTLEPVDA